MKKILTFLMHRGPDIAGIGIVIIVLITIMQMCGCKTGVKYTRASVEWKGTILSRPDVSLRSTDSITVIKIDHLDHNKDSLLIRCPNCKHIIKIN